MASHTQRPSQAASLAMRSPGDGVTFELPRRQGRPKEPAWHSRDRRLRADARALTRVAAACARLSRLHGSAVPRVLHGLVLAEKPASAKAKVERQAAEAADAARTAEEERSAAEAAEAARKAEEERRAAEAAEAARKAEKEKRAAEKAEEEEKQAAEAVEAARKTEEARRAAEKAEEEGQAAEAAEAAWKTKTEEEKRAAEKAEEEERQADPMALEGEGQHALQGAALFRSAGALQQSVGGGAFSRPRRWQGLRVGPVLQQGGLQRAARRLHGCAGRRRRRCAAGRHQREGLLSQGQGAHEPGATSWQ